jgi:uncharacterized membrane protein YfcA
LTEDESEIYDWMGLLLRRGGIRIGVPILVGAALVAVGLGELSQGLILVSLIEIAVGAVLMAYGIYVLNKRRKRYAQSSGKQSNN